MMRLLWLICLIGSLLVGVVCSQEPESNPDPSSITWIVVPKRIDKNIHFILDLSGSMNPNQIKLAIDCFLTIAGQNTDDMNIAITVFGLDAKRWGGVDGVTPRGWVSLPSKDHLDAANEWLSSVSIDDDDTCLTSAIHTIDTKSIHKVGGNIDEITVVIISDLMFSDHRISSDALKSVQKIRKKNNVPPINVGFIGILTNSNRINDLTLFKVPYWAGHLGPVKIDEPPPLPH